MKILGVIVLYLANMLPEDDKSLCEKYPKIFQNRDKTIYESCMAWGFECGHGWFELIESLCGEIQNYIDWKVKTIQDPEQVQLLQVVADQVKEKFGSLRFYYSGGDEVVHGMVRMAEALSSKICSKCGNFYDRSTNHWRRGAVCEKCIHTNNSK